MSVIRVKLNIEEISDELYDAILDEFKMKFGADATFEDWEVSAVMVNEEKTNE